VTCAPAARRVAVFVASTGAFVMLARRAKRGTVSAAEERVFHAVNKLGPALRTPAWLVMQAGSLPAVPVVAAVAFPRRRAIAFALAVDGTAVWALCKVLKRLVTRGRPADHLDGVVIRGAPQRGGGFPSGHAAVATTLTTIGRRALPSPASHIAWGIPALVFCARQYVGAHLPLDVVGGAALGLSAGTLANLALDMSRAVPA
jgi:membrane-associated phospholipid phosphatase